MDRNWVSLPVETPMGDGLLLWIDDSGTPREQLVTIDLPTFPAKAIHMSDTPHLLPPDLA